MDRTLLEWVFQTNWYFTSTVESLRLNSFINIHGNLYWIIFLHIIAWENYTIFLITCWCINFRECYLGFIFLTLWIFRDANRRHFQSILTKWKMSNLHNISFRFQMCQKVCCGSSAFWICIAFLCVSFLEGLASPTRFWRKYS